MTTGVEIEWCACIYQAHCHPGKAGLCKLREGGTVNGGGGVCRPRPPVDATVDARAAFLAGEGTLTADEVWAWAEELGWPHGRPATPLPGDEPLMVSIVHHEPTTMRRAARA